MEDKMSSDNGTYILQTYGPEYRVMHMQAIDNIYGTYIPESGKYVPNSKAIVESFASSKVFTNLEEAWDFALDMDSQVEYSEYGTCFITEFETYTFSDLEEKNAETNS